MLRSVPSLLALLLAVGLAGPAGAEPPPHAPAHGYRHKHADGVELVFDARIGVYAVAERMRHFFHEGAFFRLHEGRWQRAPHVDGPWDRLSAGKLPDPLQHLAPDGDRGAPGREARGRKPGHGGGPPKGKPGKGKGRGRGP